MPRVMSACGWVGAEQLGHILPHEHLLLNLMRESRAHGVMNDVNTLKTELMAFVRAGGRTLVELSSAPLTVGATFDSLGEMAASHRRPRVPNGTRSAENAFALRGLAEALGLNVILGTGHYREPYFDDGWIDSHSVASLAEDMIRDITDGFPDTDIRAGIIGEIGQDKWYMSAREERSFRAAARAHVITELPITTHAARWPVGLAQLDLLQEEGVDPGRVIIGHCDSVNSSEYHVELAKRGAFVEFDNIGGGTKDLMQRQVQFVLTLKSQGFLSQILLSHDVCRTDQLRSSGGPGYTFVVEEFAAALRACGLETEEVDEVLVANPRRALLSADA